MTATLHLMQATTDAAARQAAEQHAHEHGVERVVVKFPATDRSERTLDWTAWEWSIKTVLVHGR